MESIKRFDPSRFIHKCVIIDASVLLKLFLAEEGDGRVGELIRLAQEKHLTLLATPLLIFEFLNALSKRLMDPTIVKEIYRKFSQLSIGKIEPDGKYVLQAIESSCEHPQVSYYDASYHALAKDMDAIFLTADKKYYEAMKDQGHVELFC